MPEQNYSDFEESPNKEIESLPTPASSTPAPPLRHVEDRLFRKPKAERESPSRPDSARPAIKLTHRQEVEQLFRGNPANPGLAIELAELYVSEGRPYEAEKVLAQAAEATENDPQVCDRLGDVQIQRSTEKLTIARHRAVLDKTPSNREAVQQLQAAHDQLELRVYRGRCELHPDNATFAYEVALRLLRVKEYEDAIKTLENVFDDEHLGALAEFRAGEAHHRLKRFPRALQCYRHAAEKARASGQTECLKQALYLAGFLASGMRMIPQAKKYFVELRSIDPQFKDVGERLEKLSVQ